MTILGVKRDRGHFLKLLGVMAERYGVMGNRCHLLIVSLAGNVSRAMQWLNTSCGVCFNLKHGRSGALFQSRFKETSPWTNPESRRMTPG